MRWAAYVLAALLPIAHAQQGSNTDTSVRIAFQQLAPTEGALALTIANVRGFELGLGLATATSGALTLLDVEATEMEEAGWSFIIANAGKTLFALNTALLSGSDVSGSVSVGVMTLRWVENIQGSLTVCPGSLAFTDVSNEPLPFSILDCAGVPRATLRMQSSSSVAAQDIQPFLMDPARTVDVMYTSTHPVTRFSFRIGAATVDNGATLENAFGGAASEAEFALNKPTFRKLRGVMIEGLSSAIPTAVAEELLTSIQVTADDDQDTICLLSSEFDVQALRAPSAPEDALIYQQMVAAMPKVTINPAFASCSDIALGDASVAAPQPVHVPLATPMALGDSPEVMLALEGGQILASDNSIEIAVLMTNAVPVTEFSFSVVRQEGASLFPLAIGNAYGGLAADSGLVTIVAQDAVESRLLPFSNPIAPRAKPALLTYLAVSLDVVLETSLVCLSMPSFVGMNGAPLLAEDLSGCVPVIQEEAVPVQLPIPEPAPEPSPANTLSYYYFYFDEEQKSYYHYSYEGAYEDTEDEASYVDAKEPYYTYLDENSAKSGYYYYAYPDTDSNGSPAGSPCEIDCVSVSATLFGTTANLYMSMKVAISSVVVSFVDPLKGRMPVVILAVKNSEFGNELGVVWSTAQMEQGIVVGTVNDMSTLQPAMIPIATLALSPTIQGVLCFDKVTVYDEFGESMDVNVYQGCFGDFSATGDNSGDLNASQDDPDLSTKDHPKVPPSTAAPPSPPPQTDAFPSQDPPPPFQPAASPSDGAPSSPSGDLSQYSIDDLEVPDYVDYYLLGSEYYEGADDLTSYSYSADDMPELLPPTIVLNGQSTAEHNHVIEGCPYKDPGAYVIRGSQVDTTLTELVAMSGDCCPMDTSTPGARTVRYNVQDGAGNAAPEKVRHVQVVADNQKPTISLQGSTDFFLLAGANFVEPGFLAIDSCPSKHAEALALLPDDLVIPQGLQANQSCYIDYSARVTMAVVPVPDQHNVMRVEYSLVDLAGNEADKVHRIVRFVVV